MMDTNRMAASWAEDQAVRWLYRRILIVAGVLAVVGLAAYYLLA